MLAFNAGKINLIKAEIINYPDGTLKINIPSEIIHSLKSDEKVQIIWRYESEAELSALIHITENIRDNFPDTSIELYMPYLPNARMDRVHEANEVFTLRYFCKLINSLEFDKVTVIDAHSSVGPALLNRVCNISPKEYVYKALADAGINKESDYIFFPDEGSCKRYSSLFNGYKNIGFGIKKRNWEDGRITGLDVAGGSPEGKRVFIIDDICAYGGTVYYSAQKLKELGCKDISVFFTHCENSIAKGKLFTCGMINKIYTTNSICTLEPNENFVIFDCLRKEIKL